MTAGATDYSARFALVPPPELVCTTPQLVEQLLIETESERSWQIIERRFGLRGVHRRTLEELAGAFGVSRERVRQVEAKALKRLASAVKLAVQNDGVSCGVGALYEYVSATPVRAIRQDTLLSRLGLASRDPEIAGSLKLLFELNGIHQVSVSEGDVGLLWADWNSKERLQFSVVFGKLHALVTRDAVLPLEKFDLLILLNRHLGKGDRVSRSQLDELIELSGFLEQTGDGRVQAYFHRLQGRGNQALRLLAESGDALPLRSLVRAINPQCVPHGEAKLNMRNLSRQLSTDVRFEPIGKSSHWRVRNHQQARATNIVDLMEQFLIARDECASATDILAFVSDQRPVRPASISSYLNRLTDRFVEVRRGCWGLASWQRERAIDAWDRAQIAGWIASYFRQHRAREVDYLPLKQAFVSATGFTSRQANGLLGNSPAMRTELTERWRRIAIFNAGYERGLRSVPIRPISSRKTLQMLTAERTRDILQSQPRREILLGQLVERLMTEFRRPKHTFYRYLAALDFMGTIPIDGAKSGPKSCRLKNVEGLGYRARKIRSRDLRSKIERAFTYLNELEVDVGLFLLSKEFEATLRGFLEAAHSEGSLAWVPGPDVSKWRLDQLIVIAERSGLITDAAALSYLRQERNERAHGTMPSAEERQALMRAAPTLAGLYVDYIGFFANRA